MRQMQRGLEAQFNAAWNDADSKLSLKAMQNMGNFWIFNSPGERLRRPSKGKRRTVFFVRAAFSCASNFFLKEYSSGSLPSACLDSSS